MLFEMQNSSRLPNIIEGWIKQNELIREIYQMELSDFFRPYGGSLWLRGSFSRLHFPPGDVDISDYSKGRRFNFHNFPNEFEGLPIEYAHIPLESLENFLITYLRYSASADEMIPLTPDNADVGLIMEKATEHFYANMTGDYTLFRFFEEDNNYRKTQEPFWNDYRRLKETSGGKRTADRVFWLSKCLYPEYRKLRNHIELIYQMIKDNRIPVDIGCALLDIGATIKTDPNKYLALTAIIQPWYQYSFLPIVQSTLSSKLPSEHLEVILRSRNESEPEMLEEVFKNIGNLGLPHRQWLAAWVLSQNPACSQRLLANMWSQFSENLSYINVLRNLMRHPNFPIEMVHQLEIENDDHLIICFMQVCQQRRFNPSFLLG